jgi:hypothetical protein
MQGDVFQIRCGFPQLVKKKISTNLFRDCRSDQQESSESDAISALCAVVATGSWCPARFEKL